MLSLDRERRLFMYDAILDGIEMSSSFKTAVVVGIQQTIIPAVNSTFLNNRKQKWWYERARDNLRDNPERNKYPGSILISNDLDAIH